MRGSFRAMYQRSESSIYDNIKGNSYLLSMVVPINKYDIKFQYLKDDAGLGKVTKNAGADLKTLKESDASQYSVGVDFKAQKDLTFGVGISYFDGDYTDVKGHTEFDDTLIFVSTRYLF